MKLDNCPESVEVGEAVGVEVEESFIAHGHASTLALQSVPEKGGFRALERFGSGGGGRPPGRGQAAGGRTTTGTTAN